ncbi:Raffinose synthase or seed imbibition protein Sip1 [Musa troglodytarum]|uniref:Raffinose synthase or seed imbibition protein Sip1 n=1 Tax=Musa troglodytarum TaxID=320322 RepID=A0A9E7EJZ5_9LILI|nr:Raffinose synthase or seed imbibition protein Sip1 [Musa troglodytarum]
MAYSDGKPERSYVNGVEVGFEWEEDGKLIVDLAWEENNCGVSEGTAEAGFLGSHRSLALIEGERLVVIWAVEKENALANSMYQDKTRAWRELRKTSVNRLSIKIAVSEGFRVDARVHDQGSKMAVRGTVPLLLRGVGDRNDGEGGTIPKATYSKLE